MDNNETTGAADSSPRNGESTFDPSDPAELTAARKVTNPPRNVIVLCGLGAVIVALLALSVTLFSSPINLARAFGSSQQYEAVVDSVQLIHDDRCSRRHKPTWSVQMHWQQDDRTLSETVTKGSCGEPYEVGQEIQIYRAEGLPGITLSKSGPAGIWFGFVFSLVAFVVALMIFLRVKRWRRLASQIGSSPTLVGTVRSSERRKERNVNFGRGIVVIESAEIGSGAKEFKTWARDDKTLPEIDDDVRIFSLNAAFDGPALLRAERDGRWWSADG